MTRTSTLLWLFTAWEKRARLETTTTSAASSSTLAEGKGRHGLQFRRNHLAGALQNLHQFASQATVLFADKERNGKTLLPRATCTSDTMDIRLHFLGEIEIYHHTNVVNVQSTRSNIRRNKQSTLHVFEFLQGPVSFVLRLIAVHGASLKAVLAQRTRQHVATFLRFHENEDTILRRQILTKLLQKLAILVTILAGFDDLGNILVGCEIQRTHSHLVKVTQVVIGKPLNFFWPGCAPHKNLSIGTDLRANFAKLDFKTHIKHSISFVKHQVGDTFEIGVTSLQMINQSTWGCNQNFDPLLQIADLRVLFDTTIHDSVLDTT
mmetsp:Transcript_5049/g.9636  ORF Transcript_5049/g.9636 Transcript_5049/m.9636 type:complete len:321 (+) Transcript_5049:34-996(+)